ncbi:MAG: C1 family peptidase [Oscillospiraceae bacterium]|jgi:bleomycin hydrolase|nr:C1 family peptidase [Oscillospiraceae bacterium]
MPVEISAQNLASMKESFRADPANRIRMNAIIKNGAEAAAEDSRETINNPMVFSIEIPTGKITEQKKSGRCWLFAALNTLRLEVMRKLNLETFELSQAWAMFWDKLEKSNYFLESILETLDEDSDSRLIAHLLSDPIQDGGQWDMFCALAEKYGVVPKSVYPETFHSSETSAMNQLITNKLREFACSLREQRAKGAGTDELRAQKAAMLTEVYKLLCLCVGEPPERFDFEARDKDKGFHRDLGITPKEFFDKYIGRALEDYVSIINAPTADKPYYKTFTVGYLGNVKGGRPVKYLNLPVEEQKALAIAQLSDDEPVWFGCDVGKLLSRTNGIMGMHTFDYESALGSVFNMNKAQRLDYHQSVMTHAMVLLGVNLIDGKPNRWKVENSWGKDSGQEGHYIMTDEWFGEYNYQVVVNKKYLSAAQLQAWEQEPITLKPWDPMGSLA